jgi:hypothetical protein
MSFTRLTPKQAEAFRNKIQPMLRFLLFCKRRLDSRNFDPKSRLYGLVDKAYDALHSLHVELHYLSCSHGVGRPPDNQLPHH